MTTPIWDNGSVSAVLPDPEASLVAACIQLNSGDDVAANLARTESLLQQAASRGAQLVLLPENFALMAENDASKHHFSHHQAQSTIIRLGQLSHRLKLWIIAGSLITPIAKSDKLHNTSMVFAPNGNCTAQYHKIHLFDAALPGQEEHRESRLFDAGKAPVQTNINGWSIGLSICFDIRFPILFQQYRKNGCRLLTIPAAFTATTGIDHWMALLKARAIETQCFVLAAAQNGSHPGNRKTWGHSMIIDPWGNVLAEIQQDEGVICAVLNRDELEQVRHAIPMHTPTCTTDSNR